MGTFFCIKSPLKMGRGFEARSAHPCPTQIWVPPPPPGFSFLSGLWHPQQATEVVSYWQVMFVNTISSLWQGRLSRILLVPQRLFNSALKHGKTREKFFSAVLAHPPPGNRESTGLAKNWSMHHNLVLLEFSLIVSDRTNHYMWQPVGFRLLNDLPFDISQPCSILVWLN